MHSCRLLTLCNTFYLRFTLESHRKSSIDIGVFLGKGIRLNSTGVLLWLILKSKFLEGCVDFFYEEP